MNRKWQSILALMFAGAFASRATITIADWTFETSKPNGYGTTIGGINAEEGVNMSTSVASGYHASSKANWNTSTGDGSATAFSSDHWSNGDYYQFKSSTLGYNNIIVTFEARGSDSGPKNFKLAYSTDGSSFTDVGTYSLINDSWSSTVFHSASAYTFNLVTTVGVDDDATIYFRLIDTSATADGSINGGYVGTSGTSVVDDFEISGMTIVPVPEPAAWGAASSAFLLVLCGFDLLRQRASKKASSAG
jgi:hypothetical protein